MRVRQLMELKIAVFALCVSQIATSATLKTTVGTERRSNYGVSYFVFADGPGLASDRRDITPNMLGLPEDDGLRMTSYISNKYRVSDKWAIDFQLRVQWVFNNARRVKEFQNFRWQSPRIGMSGKILTGEDWSLTGAINTDFPYMVPPPLGGGYVSERRTMLLNPGLFAKFHYQAKGSAWSIHSLVMPRFFIYKDRSAAEPQLLRAGFGAGLKPEFTFSISPSLNYALTEKTGIRIGSEITYKKLVSSSWNPFNASLNGSSVDSKAWRLAAVPLQLGATYEASEALSVSAFIQGYPIAAQRVRRDGSVASFGDTLSIGMWMSGTLL